MARNRTIDDETLQRAAGQARLSGSYIALMASSGVLAAVAFAVSSIPVLLGAMIVAPLMPPIALFVVGLVAGQGRQAFRGLGVAVAGLVTAAVATALAAVLMGELGIIESQVRLLTDPLVEERVRPGWYSIVAAIAAGIAGMIGFHQQKTDTLIGTVASVALVPAAGAAGVSFAQGDATRAMGGVALTGINLCTIIAAGLIVTLVIAPRVRAHGREVEAPARAQ